MSHQQGLGLRPVQILQTPRIYLLTGWRCSETRWPRPCMAMVRRRQAACLEPLSMGSRCGQDAKLSPQVWFHACITGASGMVHPGALGAAHAAACRASPRRGWRPAKLCDTALRLLETAPCLSTSNCNGIDGVRVGPPLPSASTCHLTLMRAQLCTSGGNQGCPFQALALL